VSQRAFSLTLERSRAKGNQLLVLLCIADHARTDGRDAWPSAQTIAHWVRLTDRAVRLILHALERAGEIRIEPNLEMRRPDEAGAPPRWFLHVRCVCEWEAYQAEGLSAPRAEIGEGLSPSAAAVAAPIRLVLPRGRPRGNRKTIPISRLRKSEKTGQRIGKLFRGNRKNPDPHPYDPRTIDPRTEQEQGPAAPTLFPTGPDPTSAEECFDVVVKLAHEAFDRLGESANEVDLSDYVKRRCCSLHIPTYPPADLVGRTIDSARWQRGHRRSTS
jgi:hypothetical protein